MKVKNADVVCYMLTSLVSLKQGNIEKSEQLARIVNIEEENPHIFWTSWVMLIKFSGKMWLIIILNPLSEKCIFGKNAER